MPLAVLYSYEELLADVNEQPKRKLLCPLEPGRRFGKLTVLFLLKEKLHKRHTAYACKCDCGNHIKARVDALIDSRTTSCGCSAEFARKNNKRKLSVEEMAAQIHKNTRYTITDVGDKRANGKWVFHCPDCEGDFTATWRSVKRGQSNCCCSGKGGFKSAKPAYLYLMDVADDHNIVAIKIGITNKPVEERVKGLRRDTPLNVTIGSCFYFENGNDALEIESFIKRTYKCCFLSKEIFGTGYTETISPYDKADVLKDIHTQILKRI